MENVVKQNSTPQLANYMGGQKILFLNQASEPQLVIDVLPSKADDFKRVLIDHDIDEQFISSSSISGDSHIRLKGTQTVQQFLELIKRDSAINTFDMELDVTAGGRNTSLSEIDFFEDTLEKIGILQLANQTTAGISQQPQLYNTKEPVPDGSFTFTANGHLANGLIAQLHLPRSSSISSADLRR